MKINSKWHRKEMITRKCCLISKSVSKTPQNASVVCLGIVWGGITCWAQLISDSPFVREFTSFPSN